MPLTRRTALMALLLGGTLPCGPALAQGGWTGLEAALGPIEAGTGGRLGVAVLDTGTGARAGHRADERFPMCSTFKLLAAGAVLARADRGETSLSRRLVFTPDEVVSYSPVTQGHAGQPGMTLGELCAAALDYSDNTAANMLLRELGGPAGVTAFARSLGDGVTRLDRTETALNEARPGDPRDTTTPAAMLANLQALALGPVLAEPSRTQYVAWLKANTTGGARLKAGVPLDWQVGDKTGSGDQGTANDVALFQLPGRKPVLAAVYLTGATVPPDARNAAIAAVGRAITTALPA